MGAFGHFDGLQHRLAEGDESAFVIAGGGQIVKPLFGNFDLLAGPFVNLAAIGAVDHVFTKSD